MPVILVAFRIKSVHLRIWVATFLAIVGLYILLNPAGGEFNIGDILTFGCAVSFAVHVIFQDYYLSKGVHVSHLLLTQLMFITVFSCLSVCVFEDLSLIMSLSLIHI